MSMAAGIALCIIIFIYIELAIGFGYYMFLLTTRGLDKPKSKEETEKAAEQIKQIKRYSVLAGAFFPVTFAILMAHKAAKRG